MGQWVWGGQKSIVHTQSISEKNVNFVALIKTTTIMFFYMINTFVFYEKTFFSACIEQF